MQAVTGKKADGTVVGITSPYLSSRQAAAYLNISLRSFMEHVADTCKHKMIGNRKRYHYADLDAFEPKPKPNRPSMTEGDGCP